MPAQISRRNHGPSLLATLSLLGCAHVAAAADGDYATTMYVARVSGEAHWQDVAVDPAFTKYEPAYLAVAALSREYAQPFDGRLAVEWEGQVGYAFGPETYWQFNVVPVVARWRFEPTPNLDMSTAFGLGLSFTTSMPQTEVKLEGESHRELVYWVAELTAGPHASPWSMTLRLHHRSVAFGLMGKDGGMNAVGLGLRWRY
ncbi:MAG TPA: hypothetical protein VH542_12470 [Steroidobacteraceae bacterium]|jgi:hypothetical protein